MLETARTYRRVAWLVIQAVIGIYDQDGNLLGVQPAEQEAVYFPHGANTDALVARINRKLQEEP